MQKFVNFGVALERSTHKSSLPSEFRSKTLDSRSPLFILELAANLHLRFPEKHLPGGLEIGQLNNVKPEAGANRWTDLSNLYFGDLGKKIRWHPRLGEKSKVASSRFCRLILRCQRDKFAKVFAVAYPDMNRINRPAF